LTAGRSRTTDGLADGFEGHLEYVVQDEDHSLGWCQPLEHDQQRQANLVVEGDPVGRVDARCP
jgi:hypothetical protein